MTIYKINHKFIRGLISFVVVVSMYLVTFSTIYYNTFDSTYYPIYHIISNVFGFSFGSCAVIAAYSLQFGLPSYVNISLITLVAYNILNVTFSAMVLIDDSATFEALRPTIETFANIVFGTICTYFYAKSYFKNG
jgi:hypothetical protein